MAPFRAPSNEELLETLLREPNPFDAALGLAIALRNSGMPQAQLRQLFDDASKRHSADADDRQYDALLDVMDLIVGWCSPDRAIYPDSH